MNTFKKVFALSLLAFTLPLAGCANQQPNNSQDSGNVSEQTKEDENPQGLAFYPLDDGTYGVAFGYATQLSHVAIPDHYKGKTVTTILAEGFSNKYSLYGKDDGFKTKSITIPRSINHIERNAFGCFDEIEYLGSMEEFKAIQYDDAFFTTYSHEKSCSETLFKFSDKQIILSDTYDSLKIQIMGDDGLESHYDGDTLAFNAGSEYSKFGHIYSFIVYRMSSLGTAFDETTGIRNSLLDINVSNTDIIWLSNDQTGISPRSGGLADLTIEYLNLSATIHFDIKSLPELVLPDNLVFESKTFSYDGDYHWLEYIQNVPEDLFVYYSSQKPGNITGNGDYEYIASRYENNDHGRLISASYPGNYLQCAIFYKEGYELTYLTATLTITGD